MFSRRDACSAAEASGGTYLADAAPQVAVTCCNNVTLVLPDTLAQAVIRIGALVCARKTLHPRVLK